MSSDYEIPHQYEYHGITLNRERYPPDHLDRVRELELRADDILIASYPRTGTTFASHIISMITAPEGSLNSVVRTTISDRCVFLDRVDPGHDRVTPLLTAPGPRFVKTHLPARLCHHWLASQARVVVILRNPKDTLKSLFHFYQNLDDLGCFGGSWAEFFSLYEKGCLLDGDCVDWSAGWRAVTSARPNVHLTFYEDLIRSPREEVRGLAEFLGRSLTESHLARIVDESRFDRMKANDATNIKRTYYKKSFDFIRKGTIGDWQSVFTEFQSRVIDDKLSKHPELSFTFV